MAVLIAFAVITNSDRWKETFVDDPGSYSEPAYVTATPVPTSRPVTPTKKPVAATQKPAATATPRPATPTPRPATPTRAPAVDLFAGYSIPQSRTMYTKLNSVEQHIYRELRAAVMQDGDSCVIRKVQYKTYADSIDRAVEALTLDFSEFFWLSGGWQWKATYNGDIGDITITVKFRDYWNDGSNKRQRIATVMDQAKAVADAAMKKATHFERLRYIHDWICANTTYNYDAYETNDQENRPAAHLQAYSAYGVFAKKTAVCRGYAMAYKLIANMCGYPCEYTRGFSNGERHGWNYVTVNGNNYWIDVTWDDQDGKMGGATCKYTYFMITSKQLCLDHTVDEKLFAAPECRDTSMDYFSRYGSQFNRYDFAEINEAVKKQMAAGELVQLRFENREQLELAVEYLFGEQKQWHHFEIGSYKTVTYYRDYDQFVLSMRFNN